MSVHGHDDNTINIDIDIVTGWQGYCFDPSLSVCLFLLVSRKTQFEIMGEFS